MLKTVTLTAFIVLGIGISAATAQQTDTTKVAPQVDTNKIAPVKVDTNLLNRYRIEPRRNSLPLRIRPVQIQQQNVPVDLLDYKVSYWRKSLVWGLSFNQAAFSSNWTGGGVNAVALGTNFDFKAEYNKTPFDYTTETNLIYGLTKNKGQGARKSNDRIFLDNKVSTQLSKKWAFFGSLTFESQFAQGFQYTDPTTGADLGDHGILISNFMAPGYLTESLGFEYKPAKYFDLRLGTGTARQTFVLDPAIYDNGQTNYNVGPGHTFRNDLAFQLVATIDKDLMQNLHINARYALFVPYSQSLSYTTHRLDATLTAKVNRLIAVTINGTMLYDKSTTPVNPTTGVLEKTRVQGTEGLAIGVQYKFP